MRKIAVAIASVGTLLTPLVVLAQAASVDIKIPEQGINPNTPVGVLLSNALTIIFVIAAIAVLFMLIWGAFQWITSGGDKEKIGAARGRITNALIGLAILALAFLIVTVVGRVVNIDILKLDVLPTLDQCAKGQVFNAETGKCQTPTRS